MAAMGRHVLWALAGILLLSLNKECHGAFSPATPLVFAKRGSSKSRQSSLAMSDDDNNKNNNNAKTEQKDDFFFSVANEAVVQGQQQQQQQEEKTVNNKKVTNSLQEPTNNKGGEIVKTDFYLDVLEAIWTVGSEVAKDLFFALRRTAATALTASLPEEERQELLERTMGKERVRAAAAARKREDEDDDDYDYDYAQSMSVQENVAAAKVRDIQRTKDPKLWKKEKDAIYKEAEQAALERVETELAIQKARMDQERQQMQQDVATAQEEIQLEKEKLQALQTEIEAEKQALQQQQQQDAAEQQQQQQQQQQESAAAAEAAAAEAAAAEAAAAVQEEQQAKLVAMETALQQKEEQAKQDQNKIEQLEQKLLKAKATAATTAATTKPRIHAGRYTPEEWRGLTEEEKEQVKALREKLGPDATQKEWDSTTKSSSDAASVHPILGPVITDLGHKRIHIMSVGKLGTIPIWKKQRIYRHDRAKAMVEDKWRSMSLGLPGVICLHEGLNGKLAIIDGQHRVGMMILLRNKQRKYLQDNPNDADTFPAIDFDRVLVEVYPSSTAATTTTTTTTNEDYSASIDQHAQDMFLEINKAEPVKLIDMPGVASAKDRKIITEAVDRLYEAYPTMFSPSQRCRVPNVNVDNLRNSLFGSGCLKKHNLTTTKKLYEWILYQNALVGDKYIDSKQEQSTINAKAWKKARENRFYLGLESSWLYN